MLKKFFLLLIIILFISCNDDKQQSSNNYSKNEKTKKTEIKEEIKSVFDEVIKEKLVTFIELGSVNCVPCKMMQPVMKKIEEKYDKQVEIIFYDVWTNEGQPYGQEYSIRAIPTQVFLDKDGNEYYRHEGYFPFEELEKILKMKGVKE